MHARKELGHAGRCSAARRKSCGKNARARGGRAARARGPWNTRMSASKPLDGKCIVITRAVEQSRDLKERLEMLGARVLLLPTVSFFGPSDTMHLDRVIESLESFDWVFFTSANAVLFFADRCRTGGRSE